MLRPRVIPCLLVQNKGLVKTERFARPKYVGDPTNAVKIFNEKEVDELIVLDIDATAIGTSPDLTMIRNVAAECRMPLCYGGGVKSVEHAVEIVKLGVEKIAISSAAIEDGSLVTAVARQIGVQSVVGVLDVKRRGRRGSYELWTHNGTVNTRVDAVEFARELQGRGVGEIVVNSIDRDGTMMGYDLEIAHMIRDAVTVPMTVLGGAGSLDDIEALVRDFGVIGAAAGSLFVFKGVYRAVLINYPSREQKRAIVNAAMASP